MGFSDSWIYHDGTPASCQLQSEHHNICTESLWDVETWVVKRKQAQRSTTPAPQYHNDMVYHGKIVATLFSGKIDSV
jgi:hypothetical protein